MIIYKAINIKTGKVYIGRTEKTLENRIFYHKKSVRLKSTTHFHNALRKNGFNNFSFIILEHTNDFKKETFWINYYDSFKNGYNMTLGGDGGNTLSKKTKKELKNQGAKKGNVPWNAGIKYTPKQKSKYKLGLFHRTFTNKQKIEHSKKIKKSKKYREGLKNRVHGKAKIVLELDNNGNIIGKWNTIKDVAEHLFINRQTCRRRIYDGKMIDGRIFIFKKKDNYEK